MARLRAMISRRRTAGKRNRVGAGPPTGRDDALVDHVNPVPETLGDAADAADVAAIEMRRAEFGVVGHLDCFVIRLEAVERRRRPTRFVWSRTQKNETRATSLFAMPTRL